MHNATPAYQVVFRGSLSAQLAPEGEMQNKMTAFATVLECLIAIRINLQTQASHH